MIYLLLVKFLKDFFTYLLVGTLGVIFFAIFFREPPRIVKVLMLKDEDLLSSLVFIYVDLFSLMTAIFRFYFLFIIRLRFVFCLIFFLLVFGDLLIGLSHVDLKSCMYL